MKRSNAVYRLRGKALTIPPTCRKSSGSAFAPIPLRHELEFTLQENATQVLLNLGRGKTNYLNFLLIFLKASLGQVKTMTSKTACSWTKKKFWQL